MPPFRKGDIVSKDSLNCLYRVLHLFKVGDEWRMLVRDADSSWKDSDKTKCEGFYLVKNGWRSALHLPNFKLPKVSSSSIVVGSILAFVANMGFWLMGNYNDIVKSKAEVDKAWASVETKYQRRLDLVDNLVASVKGAQKQEIAVFGLIADARKAYNDAGTTDEKAQAASNLETNIALLPRLQEAYPELKSNALVQSLMGELTSTENGIMGARDNFNSTATNYNVGITRFPKNLVASMFDFEKAKLFEAATGAEKATKVNF
jgi:LemA protein